MLLLSLEDHPLIYIHTHTHTGRILEPEEVPIHLVSRLLHAESMMSTTSTDPSSCASLPSVETEEDDGSNPASPTSSPRSKCGGGKGCVGGKHVYCRTPSVKEDALATTQYVVEDMRFDIFIQLRELMALSSATPTAMSL